MNCRKSNYISEFHANPHLQYSSSSTFLLLRVIVKYSSYLTIKNKLSRLLDYQLFAKTFCSALLCSCFGNLQEILVV